MTVETIEIKLKKQVLLSNMLYKVFVDEQKSSNLTLPDTEEIVKCKTEISLEMRLSSTLSALM